jgi:two-component system OmpR family sensor kinase
MGHCEKSQFLRPDSAHLWFLMRQPYSIRVHLTGVFLIFFLLVVILGSFSIWRLNNFNHLSADVAELWLPETRVLGDLNNFTSDFRAFEGGNLLSSDAAESAASEGRMAALDHSIADAERAFERIRHDASETELYNQFKSHWQEYRKIVDQMLVLSRSDRKAEALSMYGTASRAPFDAASDALDRLTDLAVGNAQRASDRLGAAYRQAFWLILLGIVIAGMMVVGALVHVTRSISSPLLKLADRMRQLAANNTDTEIPETDRRDEIGEMAQATVVFRNNAIELIRSQRILARQAAMLEEQLAQEQRLALLQRNFVSMASHEFRTPRVIDGGPELYFQPAEMDVAALLHEVCQLHREMVPSAQIVERFTATVPVPITGDAKLLFQVFSNLLSNAVKYSPAGGAIEVEAGVTGDAVSVAVVDHGIGIPAADLTRLFERYHRGSNVSGIVGTGVGLYLVKIAIDLHGGRIEVQTKEGEGSRFTVTLPVKTVAVGNERQPMMGQEQVLIDAPSITVPSDGVP